jgi:NAD(P)-dependent dehydrogenase (short-subunit alcohol dehydrogenase family)
LQDRSGFFHDAGESMNKISGKTAIITGGSKGYGFGIAEALKTKGVNVWITSRHETELQVASEKLGVQYQKADVTVTEDWDHLVNTVVEETGRIDLLINNAGGGIKKAPLDEQSDRDIEQSIALNLTGVILGCKRVVPIMKKPLYTTKNENSKIMNLKLPYFRAFCKRHFQPF